MASELECFIIAIVLPTMVGRACYIAVEKQATEWSRTINLPTWAPHGQMFTICWIVTYVLSGFSSYLIYSTNIKDTNLKQAAFFTYGLQLSLSWGYIVMLYGLNYLKMSWIVLLVNTSMAVTAVFIYFPINKLASFANIPMTIWLLYLTILLFCTKSIQLNKQH